MTQPLNEPDLTLVNRCLAGEPAAWSEFCRRYQDVVFAAALEVVRSDPNATLVAEDVVGLVFARLLEGRDLLQFQGKSAFKTWLWAVARNRARQVLRAERGQKSKAAGSNMTAVAANSSCVSPVKLTERAERRHILREELARLPERERRLLTLFYDEGLSYRRLSEVTGIPLAQVGVHLARARRTLGGELKRIERP